MDEDYRPLIDEVASKLDAWELGGDLDRLQTFADLQVHPNRALRDLALRELDKAPYPVLTSLEMTPDTDRLLDRILKSSRGRFVSDPAVALGLCR